METIKIKGTEDTPYIYLDKTREVFEISGRSLPEDVNAFYEPILTWLDEYQEEPLESTDFVFKMQYFNTASSKLILDIMMKLEELKENGHNVKITWFYDQDDEDMEEAGEEFSEIVDIPFEMLSN